MPTSSAPRRGGSGTAAVWRVLLGGGSKVSGVVVLAEPGGAARSVAGARSAARSSSWSRAEQRGRRREHPHGAGSTAVSRRSRGDELGAIVDVDLDRRIWPGAGRRGRRSSSSAATWELPPVHGGDASSSLSLSRFSASSLYFPTPPRLDRAEERTNKLKLVMWSST